MLAIIIITTTSLILAAGWFFNREPKIAARKLSKTEQYILGSKC